MPLTTQPILRRSGPHGFCHHTLRGYRPRDSPESPTFIRDKKLKQMPLTKGLFALVDDEDYEVLSRYKWHADSNGYGARRAMHPDVPRKEITIYMHRGIMGLCRGDKMVIDHIDRNPRNNQRNNLRICTVAENGRNTALNSRNTSGYKGVCWNKNQKLWMASIRVHGKRTHLGCFPTAEFAYDAYCRAAVVLHGDFVNHELIAPVAGSCGTLTIECKQKNKTGYTGVKRIADSRWEAYIKIDRKKKYLGSFPSPESAHEAYRKAKKERDGSIDIKEAA